MHFLWKMLEPKIYKILNGENEKKNQEGVNNKQSKDKIETMHISVHTDPAFTKIYPSESFMVQTKNKM